MTTHTSERRLLAVCPVLALACTDDVPPMQGTDTSGSATSMLVTTSSTSHASSTLVVDDGSITTGPMPCMGNEDCTNSGAPFCEPISVDGACVECTPQDPLVCDDQLLCDAEANICVPCTEHRPDRPVDFPSG